MYSLYTCVMSSLEWGKVVLCGACRTLGRSLALVLSVFIKFNSSVKVDSKGNWHDVVRNWDIVQSDGSLIG